MHVDIFEIDLILSLVQCEHTTHSKKSVKKEYEL